MPNGTILDIILLMQQAIKPRLNQLRFFQGDTFTRLSQPIIDSHEGWVVNGEFSIIDDGVLIYNKSKPFYKKRIGNSDGDLGYVFPFVICNRKYADTHARELKKLTFQPLVVDRFDQDKVKSILADKIAEIGGDVPFNELIKHLSSFADVDYDSLPD